MLKINKNCDRENVIKRVKHISIYLCVHLIKR